MSTVPENRDECSDDMVRNDTQCQAVTSGAMPKPA